MRNRKLFSGLGIQHPNISSSRKIKLTGGSDQGNYSTKFPRTEELEFFPEYPAQQIKGERTKHNVRKFRNTVAQCSEFVWKSYKLPKRRRRAHKEPGGKMKISGKTPTARRKMEQYLQSSKRKAFPT